jgi:hypothetical protein
MIRKCVPIPQKIYKITETQIAKVEQYFPEFMACIDSAEQQIPIHVVKDRRKMYYFLGKKKRHINQESDYG